MIAGVNCQTRNTTAESGQSRDDNLHHGERETERERDRERARERETERQRDRQTDRERQS